MNKLLCFFVIAIFTKCVSTYNKKAVQQKENNNKYEDVKNMYGFKLPFWLLGNRNQLPIQNQYLTQKQFPGPNELPGQNQLPRQRLTTPSTGRSSTTTTLSPKVLQCIASCQATSEYNPVCGTNNVTYQNPGRLMCDQNCGVNVTMLRTSRCPTPAAQ